MDARGEHVVWTGLLSSWTLTSCFIAIAFRWWYRSKIRVCTSKRRLDGLTALVTGANTGIGLETARDLARRGARVLLACRDPQRGQRAVEAVRAVATGGASVELYLLDVGSLASVRACAAEIISAESRLDILVNNACAIGLGVGPTSDGLHRGLQVNHLGPFLFTLLLIPLVKKSTPSRIIFVSSLAHGYATLKPDMLDLSYARKVYDVRIYGLTKLANVLTSNELGRKLRGTGVTVNSVHTGPTQTDLFRHFPYGLDKVATFAFGLFFKSAVEGAQTSIHVAVSEEVEGVTGRYFDNCKEKRMAKAAYDEALARAVWKKSEELVKLTDQERPSYDK